MQSLRYVSSEAGAAGVRAIFDGIADSEHGSNNGTKVPILTHLLVQTYRY